MSRVFVTFATGEQYENLAKVLRESINSFSKYELITYGPQNFDIEYRSELWDGPSSINFSYKIMSCLKALEEYDEVVWLDNDCLVTKNIDKIWEYKVDNYPLLPTERFNNFQVWPNSKPDYQDSNFLKESKLRIGVTDNDFNNIYLQACCMLLNKDCKEFFNEVMRYYSDYDSSVFDFGDESIINCMIWRDKFTSNLGDVFLCSHYFSPYTIEGALMSSNEEEYFNVFDINNRKEGMNEDNIFLSHGWSLARHNRIGLINNNFENLLFIHGSKDSNIHRSYLNKLKDWIDTSAK
jgi:hypothetical protein